MYVYKAYLYINRYYVDISHVCTMMHLIKVTTLSLWRNIIIYRSDCSMFKVVQIYRSDHSADCILVMHTHYILYHTHIHNELSI